VNLRSASQQASGLGFTIAGQRAKMNTFEREALEGLRAKGSLNTRERSC
jgi:hypothetical protein